jgi:transketolase
LWELVRRTFAKLDLYIPSVRVIDCHTRKSLDVETVLRAARETGAIVAAENSIILGGLGGAVAEVVVKNPRTRMKHFGVQDRFAESGPYLALPDKYGLSVPHMRILCGT